MKNKELISVFVSVLMIAGVPLLATWDHLRVTRAMKKDRGSV